MNEPSNEDLEHTNQENESRNIYFIEGYIQASYTDDIADSNYPLLKTQQQNGDLPRRENCTPDAPVQKDKHKENGLFYRKRNGPVTDAILENGIDKHDIALPANGAESSSSHTVISCHNLSYTVKVARQGATGRTVRCCRSEDKAILQNINGIFKPGLNAILGATGSGKTTMLDTLAGRKNPDGMSGHVLVNGTSQPKNFKCMAGYVVQDDIVMGTLTVRENIMFSANLRLSKNISDKQKKKMVDETIQELCLERCADTRVGNEFIRGISGGEKKRTNIGMELIISPHLLFLDEPTSGLDSNTATSVVRLLSRLSKRGRTIIFSIHQPRYSIYKLFDNLLLLARGRTMFHGPMSEALSYFTGLGYACESNNNPSDFFLDIINGDPEVIKMNTPSSGYTYIAPVECTEKAALTTSEDNDPHAELAELYAKSRWCKRIDQELTVIDKLYNSSNKDGAEYVIGFPTQLKYVAKRTITNVIRDPTAIIYQVVAMMAQAIIGGFIFYDLDREIPAALQNRAGFFFFAAMSSAFPNLAAIELFIKERTLFIHEHSNGFYGTSAYFISKIIFDFIPMRIFPTVIYAVISYFIVGLKPELGAFLFYVLILALSSLTTASMCLCAGVSCGIYAVAHAITSLFLVVSAVFGGLLANLETIPVALQWLKYLSFTKYGFGAMLINDLRDQTFLAQNMTTGDFDIEVPAGNEYLVSLGINYETAWDKWQNAAALTILCLFFLVTSYIQLVRINKYK